MQDLETTFQVVKTQLLEQVNQKLLNYLSKLETYSDEFERYESLVTSHADFNSRSLFQAFVDNQITPSKIEACRNNLMSIQSPGTIKKQFALMMGSLELTCMGHIESILSDKVAEILARSKYELTQFRERKPVNFEKLLKLAESKGPRDWEDEQPSERVCQKCKGELPSSDQKI